MEPIGRVRTKAQTVPRHYSVSDVSGVIEIDPRYELGLRDIASGQKIVVLFAFHKSPPFSPELLLQAPPHKGGQQFGVFSICSPKRPNPIGMSVLEVLGREGAAIAVKGLDMLDGTPVLDIKPYFKEGE